MDQKHFNLVVKKICGELSADDEVALEAWLSISNEHRTAYAEIQKIWEASARLYPESSPDMDKAWAQLQARIEGRSQLFKKSRLRGISALRVAAAVIALLVLIFLLKLLFTGTKTNAVVRLATADNAAVYFLPDSSKLILNKSSEVSYVRNFEDTARIVYLKGEGYFEVKKSRRSFIVLAENTETKVLGTSFNLRAYPNEQNLLLEVVEGKVEFKYEDDTGTDKSISLRENQSIKYDTRSGEVTSGTINSSKWWPQFQKKIKNIFKKR